MNFDLNTIPVEALPLLFAFAVVAGFIDTLAGGGGLITIPALIMSGAPPLLALGTNKLQSSVGTATATWHMLRSGKVIWHEAKWLMLAALVGSTAGTIGIQFIDTKALSFVIPGALVLIAVYFILSPRPKEVPNEPKISAKAYRNLVVPGIGCYDGMFGPGTGSFFALAGVALRGKDIVSSTANAKALNFATNVASLAVFVVAGKILWVAGFVMMCGQAIGASIGSRCLLSIRPALLRWIVVAMCLGMLVRYGRAQGWW